VLGLDGGASNRSERVRLVAASAVGHVVRRHLADSDILLSDWRLERLGWLRPALANPFVVFQLDELCRVESHVIANRALDGDVLHSGFHSGFVGRHMDLGSQVFRSQVRPLVACRISLLSKIKAL